MKKNRIVQAIFALCITAYAPSAFAQLNIPSDGSDGALNITQDTVIDLSLAPTGNWSDNNAANAGKGVYDPNQWAVVFKYASVNIASGKTVTFKNHASRAPVAWLVQSDVTIDGVVSVDGGFYNSDPIGRLTPTEPGPGGFRGGSSSSLGFGAGYGPAGAQPQPNNPGGYSNGGPYGAGYGNPEIVPLIGGSGGGVKDYYIANGTYIIPAGASGAGAILIASTKTITIGGQVSARGGGGFISATGDSRYGGMFGGDGAIRLVADAIQGTGSINAGAGRTRAEANTMSPSLVITPNTSAVPPGATPQIWPQATAPTAKVLKVNNQDPRPIPLADVTTTADAAIQTTGAVDVIIETKNFPPSGAVNLRVVPKYANFYDVAANYVSGTFSSSTWKASTALPLGFCVLQAHATSP